MILNRNRSGIIAAQAVNSAGTLVFTATAATMLGVRHFGMFAIVQIAVLLFQGMAEGGIVDPLLRAPASLRSRLGTLEPSVTGMSVVAAVAGLLAWGVHAPQPVVVVLLGAFVALQVIRLDFTRAAFVTSGRIRLVLASDVASSTLRVLVLVLALRTLERSVVVAVLAWGSALALVSAVQILVAARLRLYDRPARLPFLHAVRVRYAFETGAVQGSSQIAQLAVVGVLGLGFAAGYRVSQTVLGVSSIMFQAARLLLVPRFARARPPLRSIAVIALALAGFSIVCSAIGWLVLATYGDRVFGDAAEQALPLMLPVSAFYATQAAYLCFFLNARAQFLDRAVSQSRAVQIVSISTATVLVLAGGSRFHFLWGLVASNSLAIVPLIRAAARASRSAETPGSGD